MTALPVLSASASMLACQHSMSSQQMSMDLPVADVSNQQADMDMPDCHKPLNCNDISCDCDNGQTSYTTLATLPSTLFKFQKDSYKPLFQALHLISIPDSLYRPPIAHLI